MAIFNCKRTTYSNHICNKVKCSDKQETAVSLVLHLKRLHSHLLMVLQKLCMNKNYAKQISQMFLKFNRGPSNS